MILLFKLIILTSIWTLGIKIATAEGMVLEKLGKWGQKKVEEGHKIYEALFVCHFCMPSIHSVLGYAFAFGLGIIAHFEWKLVIMYPLVVMGTSLLNGIVWGWHLKADAQTDFYKSGKETADTITDSIYESYDREEEYFEQIKN